MTEREIVSDLIDTIGTALNSGPVCRSMRFCLVVWCDCTDRPMYIGGNEGDISRAIKMMQIASDGIFTVDAGEVRGTA